MHQADANRGTNEEREREQEQASPSSLPNLNCGLEILPTEVLVAILSAARSTADLHALIRASPRLYQVFVPAKREVLLSIVATDLGAALRDALAVLLIAPPKLDYRKPTYLEECERVIRRYEALPRNGDRGLALVACGLPTDAVIALSHLNRSVQFLVDEFAGTRLPELHKVYPATAGPPTAAERRRLARALLRHQVLARIEHGDDRLHVEDGQYLPRETAVMYRFLGLFRPWETEQLAEVHSFLGEMVRRAFPPPLGLRESYRPKTPWEQRRDVAIYDLRLMYRELLAYQARVATDPIAASRSRRPAWGRIGLSAHFRFLRAGPLPDQEGVPCYVAPECRGLRDELYQREDAIPPLEPTENDDDHNNDDNDAAPPFAWVDAHSRLDCQRWGDQLYREVLREGQEDTTSLQRIWVRENLDKWRWLGFVFWDRARVELLKTRMPVYETGWLRAAPPSNEELQESYQKARLLSSQATRPSRRGNTVQGGEAMR
jgi:hypothetical protein